MAQITPSLTVKIAPWVRWYIAGVALFARMTGWEPDLDKVRRTALRGISVHTESGKRIG